MIRNFVPKLGVSSDRVVRDLLLVRTLIGFLPINQVWLTAFRSLISIVDLKV